MSLANAIHRYWGNTAELVEQVPLARLITGKVPDDLIVRPYVIIEYAKESERDSSTVVVDNYTVTFTVVADTDEDAETITQLITKKYDDSEAIERLHMDGNEELLASYETSTSVGEPEPSIWQGVVTFRFMVGTMVETPTT